MTDRADSSQAREQATPASAPQESSVDDSSVDVSFLDGVLLDDESAEGDSVSGTNAIDELTADLQRLHAEYANYRKRVERDREGVRQLAVANSLAELLPVLDDVERARQHGDLEGAFRSVGESLETIVGRLGMERFGEPGDEFDPALHQAVSSDPSPDVTVPTCVSIYAPGYRFAGRVVRPAVVAVQQPE